MKLRHISMSLQVLLGVASLSWAAPPEPTKPYDLPTCVALGLERNPTLQKLAMNVAVARENIYRAEGVYDTRLSLRGSYEDSELPSSQVPTQGASTSLLGQGEVAKSFSYGTRLAVDASLNRFEFPSAELGPGEIDSTAVGLSLSQPFMKNFLGRLDRSRVGAAEAAFEAARLSYLYERDRLAAQIYDAYWTANAARKRFEVNESALERARALLEDNRRKYDDGLLDETEILAAEAALATREVDVLSSRDAVSTTQDLLFELISVPVKAWDETQVFFYDEPPPVEKIERVSMEAAFVEAEQSRYDLAAIRSLRRQALEERNARREEARPDLSLVGSLARGDTGTSMPESTGFDKTVWSVGLQFEVPWERRAEKAALKQAELALAQVDRDYEALERRVLLECRLAARDLSTSLERVDAAARSRDIEARKLKREQEKMAQGRSTTRFVLEYQDDLEFAEVGHVDAIAQYQRDLARYRLVQGVLLDVLGLEGAALDFTEAPR